jgi:hypothetical protein
MKQAFCDNEGHQQSLGKGSLCLRKGWGLLHVTNVHLGPSLALNLEGKI